MQDKNPNESFFLWLKEKTEDAWQELDNEDLPAHMVSGCVWQCATRWLEGLSSLQIKECELKWHIQFPSDYRLFLQLLHAPDQDMKCFTYDKNDRLAESSRPGFYNWFIHTREIVDALAWPHECIRNLIIENGIWLPQWGEKPYDIEAQQRKIVGILNKNRSVSLIPIRYNFYMVEGQNEGTGMILSIPPAQPEVALYASDLRKFLLFEFAELLQIAPPATCNLEDYYRARRIPFWGDLVM